MVKSAGDDLRRSLYLGVDFSGFGGNRSRRQYQRGCASWHTLNNRSVEVWVLKTSVQESIQKLYLHAQVAVMAKGTLMFNQLFHMQ